MNALKLVRAIVAPWTFLTFNFDLVSALVLGGSSLLGGALGARGARDAANAAQSGTQAGIAEQRRQFDAIQRLLAPQMALGNQARARAASLLGLAPGNAPFTTQGVLSATGARPSLGDVRSGIMGDLSEARMGFIPGNTLANLLAGAARDTGAVGSSGQSAESLGLTAPFEGSPGFQFITDQAREQIEANMAARGGLRSGGTQAAIADRISNLASLDFNNEINRLLALANGTQAATSQLTSGAMASGTNVANLLQTGGQARASGILGAANSIGGALNSFGTNLALMNVLGGGSNIMPGDLPIPGTTAHRGLGGL